MGAAPSLSPSPLPFARTFTDRGRMSVECWVSDGRLVTRVVDTGLGIKSEEMDKLFKPFQQQLDTGLTRRREGD